MKKIHFAAIMFATLALASSCSDKGPQKGDLVDQEFTVSISGFEYSAESKAVIKNLTPTFVAGDQLSVYDGVNTSAFVAALGADNVLSFKGQAGYNADAFYAAFPYDKASDFSSSSVKIALSASQKAGQDVVLAVGKADAQKVFALKNTVGYIEVAVPEGATSVVVESDKEAIAGTLTVNPETGKVKEVSGETSITLSPSSSAFAEGKYLVAVAPQDYTQVTVTTVLAGGVKLSKSAALISIDRGMVTKIDSVAISTSTAYNIKSAADLKAWAAASESWSEYDVVTLEADIDMNGIEWTPVLFRGSFNGNGHNIYNFVQTVEAVNSGFFSHMYGVLENVNFGTKDGSKYDGVSKITVKGEDNGSWWYEGVIAKAYGTISNVKNFVNVEIDKDCTGKIRGAAFIALAGAQDMKISGITNYGSLKSYAEAKEKAAETIFGGIVACADAGEAGKLVNITKCNNYGEVISQDPYTTCVGGILGNCPSTKCAVLDDCHNYANIAINTTATPSSYKEGYVGGVAGLLNGNNQAGTELKNCSNEADLTVSGITVGNVGGVAARNSCAVYTNCTNNGKVTFDGDVAGKALLIGGITGGIYTGGTLENCVNNGAVSANKNQVNRAGGLVGTANSGTIVIKNCKNTASVSVVRTAANANWQAAGGLVGFQEKSTKMTVEGCSNSGAVKVEMENNTTHKYQVAAGGLFGLLVVNVDSKNNVNTGNVSANTTGTALSYAGGVCGWTQAETITSSSDESVCEVNAGTYAGAVIGSNGGIQYDYTKTPATQTGLKAAVITGAKVGGKVNGTALTAANVKTLAAGAGTAITDVTLK